MPKSLGSPLGSLEAARWAQSALRVGGWSFTIAGLGYALMWALAPLKIADDISILIVASAMVATLGYTVRAFMACRQQRTPSGVS
jgi:hypothetical protein